LGAEFPSRASDSTAVSRDTPIVLEIGFGMGEATIELAAAHPEVGYVGIEVHKPGVGKVLSEIETNGLSNLLVIHYDAVAVLSDMIAPGTLAGVHLFFPDPWPKKKHHKRRLVQPVLARLLASRIREGGYLYAVTDWEDYARQMLDVFESTRTLVNQFETFACDIPWRPTTSFERKGRAKRHRIRELFYRKSV
jgi:tRNA (guanine-N7-)-methyltransferase